MAFLSAAGPQITVADYAAAGHQNIVDLLSCSRFPEMVGHETDLFKGAMAGVQQQIIDFRNQQKPYQSQYHLTPPELAYLAQLYPEFLIKAGVRSHDHGAAFTAQALSQKLILERIAAESGPDDRITDVGSKFSKAIDLPNVHMIVCKLEAADIPRRNDDAVRAAMVQNINKTTKPARFQNVIRGSVHNAGNNSDFPLMCNRTIQQCDHRTDHIICVDAAYDIPVTDLLHFMVRTGARTLYLSMHLIGQLLITDSFEEPITKLRAHRDADKIYMRFGNASNAYVHSLRNYAAWLTAPASIYTMGHTFHLERVESRGTRALIRVTYTRGMLPDHQAVALPMPCTDQNSLLILSLPHRAQEEPGDAHRTIITQAHWDSILAKGYEVVNAIVGSGKANREDICKAITQVTRYAKTTMSALSINGRHFEYTKLLTDPLIAATVAVVISIHELTAAVADVRAGVDANAKVKRASSSIFDAAILALSMIFEPTTEAILKPITSFMSAPFSKLKAKLLQFAIRRMDVPRATPLRPLRTVRGIQLFRTMAANPELFTTADFLFALENADDVVDLRGDVEPTPGNQLFVPFRDVHRGILPQGLLPRCDHRVVQYLFEDYARGFVEHNRNFELFHINEPKLYLPAVQPDLTSCSLLQRICYAAVCSAATVQNLRSVAIISECRQHLNSMRTTKGSRLVGNVQYFAERDYTNQGQGYDYVFTDRGVTMVEPDGTIDKTGVTHVLVADCLKYFYSDEIVRVFEATSKLTIPRFAFTRVRGVAGCGKSRVIIGSVAEGDLVLAPNREQVNDLRQAIRGNRGENFRCDVRTIDSAVMNIFELMEAEYPFQRVIVDESFLACWGLIVFVAAQLSIEDVVLLGDPKQNKFASFVNHVSVLYDIPPDDVIENDLCLTISGRISRKQARLVRHVYDNEMTTATGVDGQLITVIGGAAALVGLDIEAVIVYSQDAKSAVRSVLPNTPVFTSTECQGKTYDRVAFFRDRATEDQRFLLQDACFSQAQLVAFTRARHTTYYVTPKADSISEEINAANLSNENVDSTMADLEGQQRAIVEILTRDTEIMSVSSTAAQEQEHNAFIVNVNYGVDTIHDAKCCVFVDATKDVDQQVNSILPKMSAAPAIIIAGNAPDDVKRQFMQRIDRSCTVRPTVSPGNTAIVRFVEKSSNEGLFVPVDNVRMVDSYTEFLTARERKNPDATFSDDECALHAAYEIYNRTISQPSSIEGLRAWFKAQFLRTSNSDPRRLLTALCGPALVIAQIFPNDFLPKLRLGYLIHSANHWAFADDVNIISTAHVGVAAGMKIFVVIRNQAINEVPPINVLSYLVDAYNRNPYPDALVKPTVPTGAGRTCSRAFWKMWEYFHTFGLPNAQPNGCFVDIGAAPGGFIAATDRYFVPPLHRAKSTYIAISPTGDGYCNFDRNLRPDNIHLYQVEDIDPLTVDTVGTYIDTIRRLNGRQRIGYVYCDAAKPVEGMDYARSHAKTLRALSLFVRETSDLVDAETVFFVKIFVPLTAGLDESDHAIIAFMRLFRSIQKFRPAFTKTVSSELYLVCHGRDTNRHRSVIDRYMNYKFSVIQTLINAHHAAVGGKPTFDQATLDVWSESLDINGATVDLPDDSSIESATSEVTNPDLLSNATSDRVEPTDDLERLLGKSVETLDDADLKIGCLLLGQLLLHGDEDNAARLRRKLEVSSAFLRARRARQPSDDASDESTTETVENCGSPVFGSALPVPVERPLEPDLVAADQQPPPLQPNPLPVEDRPPAVDQQPPPPQPIALPDDDRPPLAPPPLDLPALHDDDDEYVDAPADVPPPHVEPPAPQVRRLAEIAGPPEPQVDDHPDARPAPQLVAPAAVAPVVVPEVEPPQPAQPRLRTRCRRAVVATANRTAAAVAAGARSIEQYLQQLFDQFGRGPAEADATDRLGRYNELCEKYRANGVEFPCAFAVTELYVGRDRSVEDGWGADVVRNINFNDYGLYVRPARVRKPHNDIHFLFDRNTERAIRRPATICGPAMRDQLPIGHWTVEDQPFRLTNNTYVSFDVIRFDRDKRLPHELVDRFLRPIVECNALDMNSSHYADLYWALFDRLVFEFPTYAAPRSCLYNVQQHLSVLCRRLDYLYKPETPVDYVLSPTPPDRVVENLPLDERLTIFRPYFVDKRSNNMPFTDADCRSPHGLLVGRTYLPCRYGLTLPKVAADFLKRATCYDGRRVEFIIHAIDYEMFSRVVSIQRATPFDPKQPYKLITVTARTDSYIPFRTPRIKLANLGNLPGKGKISGFVKATFEVENPDYDVVHEIVRQDDHVTQSLEPAIQAADVAGYLPRTGPTLHYARLYPATGDVATADVNVRVEHGVLQEAFVAAVPTSYTAPIYEHTELVRTCRQLTVFNDNMKITTSKIGTTRPDRPPKLMPVLKTAESAPRRNELKETLLAASKRNFDASSVALPGDVDNTARLMVLNAFAMAGRDGWQHLVEQFLDEPAGASPSDYADWYGNLETAKSRKLDVDGLRNVEDLPWSTYDLSLKPTTKANLSTKAATDYNLSQVIAAAATDVNAATSPMFRTLMGRFQQLLDDRFLVAQGGTTEDFERFFRIYMSDIGYGLRVAELDASNYDKSQLAMAHAIKMAAYRYLGADPELLRIWEASHVATVNHARQAGLSFAVAYQHKSGDATTTIGNTLLNLISVMWVLRGHYVPAGAFLGDDNLIIVPCTLATKVLTDDLQLAFNISSKVIMMSTPLFCGNFLVRTPDGLRLMPDPVKRASKLGSYCMHDRQHVKEAFHSFKDLARAYRNSADNRLLAVAVAERYGVNYDFSLMIDTLYTLSQHENLFMRLYVADQ